MELVDILSWSGGLVVAVITIYLTIRHFKTSKTISYIERLNTSEMASIRAEIDEWLNSDMNEKQKCKFAVKTKDLNAKIMVWLNIFTEIGISYKQRIIRRKLTRELFYPMIPNYWKELHFYINYRRKKGYPIGYYFEYIANEVRKTEGKNKSTLLKRYSKIANN
ncbi:hypothetical protein RXV94_06945 [Yeosuana sp. MJ-SS3]|jgi:hypothetical protein|uniref:DUF4760 domain-containing protein n=1 Tax=Gilvirhabdus luticola TaxID=3079858 RepID=A0ABU3U697_9FLAO|nr:hypothetical protein [Yeosuana sp. MJ-SS3]MDU8885891.1 hypothetical protein [Yeosuana sp. MJ-SS3]